MDADLILVGGGLANTLIAMRLRAHHPELKLLLLERDTALGGNHTWCFHGSDLTPAQHEWLAPCVARSWSRHRIQFPHRDRWLEGSYHAITAESLAEIAQEQLGDAVHTDMQVAQVDSDGVSLADGTRLNAPAVIDGRGDPGGRHLDVRFQKFLGQLVELEEPVELDAPILMDARVPQLDGFRFMYVLPFSDRHVLLEDTRYSDTPGLDREPMRAAIRDYASERGWRISRLLREEEGALPVVLGGDLAAYWAEGPGVPRSGIRAGLFHYTTGYSLGEAVRLADDLSSFGAFQSPDLYAYIRARSFRLWRSGLYFRLLNRMLFIASKPEERYRILEHFYRLPAPLVGRFYGGRLTWADRARILSGKPPVPVGRAIGSLFAGPVRDNAGQPGGSA